MNIKNLALALKTAATPEAQAALVDAYIAAGVMDQVSEALKAEGN